MNIVKSEKRNFRTGMNTYEEFKVNVVFESNEGRIRVMIIKLPCGEYQDFYYNNNEECWKVLTDPRYHVSLANSWEQEEVGVEPPAELYCYAPNSMMDDNYPIMIQDMLKYNADSSSLNPKGDNFEDNFQKYLDKLVENLECPKYFLTHLKSSFNCNGSIVVTCSYTEVGCDESHYVGYLEAIPIDEFGCRVMNRNTPIMGYKFRAEMEFTNYSGITALFTEYCNQISNALTQSV